MGFSIGSVVSRCFSLTLLDLQREKGRRDICSEFNMQPMSFCRVEGAPMRKAVRLIGRE